MYADIQEIFDAHCTNCHGDTSPSSSLSLTSENNIIEVYSGQVPSLYLIQPFSSENSYLYKKIIGVDINGSQMPMGESPLSTDQISIIQDWIDNGAG